MSTQRKLWLGFGTLLVVLTLTVLGLALWLRLLGGTLRDLLERGEPARRAAYEMKLNSSATGLAVLNYLHTGAAGYRDRVLDGAAEFHKFNAQYQRAVPSQSELAKQVAAVYEEYYVLGMRLMEARDKESEQYEQVRQALAADLAEVRAQFDADEGRARSAAKFEALRGMERSFDATALALGAFRHTVAEEEKQSLRTAQADFRTWFGKYTKLSLSQQESEWATALATRTAATLTQVDEVIAAMEERQQDLQRLFYLGIRLDTLFDEGVLKLAQRDLLGGGEAARDALRNIQAGAGVSLVLGVMVSLLTAVLVSRGIVRMEETLRVTLRSIGDAVIATDRAGHVTYLNPVAESLTGWTQEEAVSLPLPQVLHIVEEATRVAVPDPTKEVVRLGTVLGLSSHTLLIAKDGSERSIDDSAAPILDLQGRVVGVVLVFRDATQRRTDEQLLRDADRRKNEFLAMLAHELRNPLAPLRNGVYILRAPGVDAKTADGVLDMMLRQLQNMTRMIDDLLDVSRITRGKIELRREPLDMTALVARVADIQRPEFEAAGRTLVASLAPQSLYVDGDSTRLEQVAGNLLTNALKYTRPGGHVWLEVEPEDGMVAMRVRDDGIGLTPEMLPQIFDLFAQADSTIARSQGGLGIGLTLVRNLVELHGGSVRAASDGAGRGSEFVVYLPRSSRGEGPARVSVANAMQEAPRRLRVLVVDDNADSAESLALLLSLRGHEVQTAHDGPAALEAARAIQPQLILLDIGLPGIDGYEVAIQLRAMPDLRDVVLVAITGYGRPEDVRRSQQAGFDQHLIKPVDIESLVSLLDGSHPPRPA